MAAVRDTDTLLRLFGDQTAANKYEDFRFQAILHIEDTKRACDEMTHTELARSNDKNVKQQREILQWFKDKYGERSLVYNSVLKSIIVLELPRDYIVNKVKQEGRLPAAYQTGMIAKPKVTDRYVVDFRVEADRVALEDVQDEKIERNRDDDEVRRHSNMLRLTRFMKRRFQRYMGKLKPKIYVLRNSSGTRMQDYVNITDINGICYITEEEAYRVEHEWKPIIEYFKILNFEEDMQYKEYECNNGTFGSINYAPDDSGKIRISYTIDPVVQVISKAIHEALDYCLKAVACNGTYDQMRVIRNIIRNQWNQKTIVSTDMSKYSDTLQFSAIGQVLEAIGIPHDVVIAMRDLYTLPMWDNVLSQVTPRTLSSYQGQYGDFPMITLKNLYNQCVVYDYVNTMYGEKYQVVVKARFNRKKGRWIDNRSFNSAVGDDTIMSFITWKRDAEELYEIIRAVFNYDGVNINKTKTHWIEHGKGSCDFIKRIIDPQGLRPYLRLSALEGDLDDKCEELLRYFRDNLLDIDEWKETCQLVLQEKADFLVNLHPICGGVIDRPISEDDLRQLIRRNEAVHRIYEHEPDGLRIWLSRQDEEGFNILESPLLGWLDSDDYYVTVESREQEEDISFEDLISGVVQEAEEESTDLKEKLIGRLLSSDRLGYKYYKLENLDRFVGLTYEQCSKFPDFTNFIEDFDRREAYRCMIGNKKLKRSRTYSALYSREELPYDITDITRPELISTSGQASDYLLSLARKRWDARCTRIKRFSGLYDMTVFGTVYHYVKMSGQTYRLYYAETSDYQIIPYDVFKIMMDMNCSEDRWKELYFQATGVSV
jgi:hypothetical protein